MAVVDSVVLCFRLVTVSGARTLKKSFVSCELPHCEKICFSPKALLTLFRPTKIDVCVASRLKIVLVAISPDSHLKKLFKTFKQYVQK